MDLTKLFYCYNIVITMQTQTIFQAGNSSVVALPKDLMKDLKFKKGQKVTVSKLQDEEAIVIKKLIAKGAKTKDLRIKPSLTPEFKQWLDQFVVEYKDVLQDLAKL